MLNVYILIFIIKILEKLKRIKIFFIKNKKENSLNIEKFCKFVKYKLSSKNFNNEKFILMDCCNIPSYVITNLILCKELRRLMKANVITYDIYKRETTMEKIMFSYNSLHILIQLNNDHEKECLNYFKKIFLKLKNKKDLFDLKVKNIPIGIDIYETILKNRNPTIKFGSLEMYEKIYMALQYFVFFQDLFIKKKIVCLCLSDNAYINTGIITRLAYKHSVPVFHANPMEINRTEKNFQLHNRFNRYKIYFRNLSKKKQKTAILKSKKLIKARLSGQTKVKMFYQEKSAFTHKIIDRQLSNSKKNKIIITTHCFFDNPSAYGGMLFKDFYEWLVFIGQQTKKLDYEIYIKPHRDYLPGTIETLKKIETKFPKLKVINSEVSFHQLKKEGASVILTVYGSVGHELPLMDFLVINAGYNPHYNYSFNIHPKNLTEYKKILKNINNYKSKKNLNEIYEFFYVHYILNHNDKFFFNSTEKYMKYINYKLKSSKCYNFFLRNSKTYIERYRKHIKDSIKSNRCFSVEKNLKASLQQKLKKNNLSYLLK